MPILKMNCIVCNKEYIGGIFPSRTTKFCERSCMSKSYTIPLIKKSCLKCNKEFECKARYVNKRKYCSDKCKPWHGNQSGNEKRRGTGFWANATEEQKLKRLTEMYHNLVIKTEGCWSWKNNGRQNGYCYLAPVRNVGILVHRLSWIIHNGPIPDKKWVLHKCDNASCSNPDHLFVGTPKDNTQDMHKKGRAVIHKGESRWNVKLNSENVLEIRRLTKEGISQSKLAKKFTVSPGTIQNIINGRSWKHIKEGT